MKPIDQQTRQRKNKGSLSVFEEFAEPSGSGSIMFTPPLEDDSLQKIEERTKLADLPAAERLDKLETKWRQTEDKLETQPRTNQRQSGDKLETLRRETEDKKLETRDKLETQPRTQLETKWRQTEDKLETKITFSELVGLQRDLIVFFYESCKLTRTSFTERLSIEHIGATCETSTSSVKKTIQRLENKGLLQRKEFKNGRGGWTVYEIPSGIYQDLLQAETRDKLRTNWRQTRDKVESQLETQPETTPSSSSSILNIKNITTTEPVDLEWQNISLGLSEGLGLSQYHVLRARTLYPGLDPVDVQKLIYGFEKHLSLSENKKAIRNPGAFFLSLAEKLSKGESPLPDYKSPDDELIERLQAEARAKYQKHQERLNALQAVLFENWWVETSFEEKGRLVPSGHVKGDIYKSAVKSKWLEEVWPDTTEARALNEVTS